MLLPGFLLTGVEAERERSSEREGRILAEVVVARGVAHLDSPALYGVEHLQPGNDLACGEHLDLEFVVGDLGDALGHVFGTAVKGVERFRPTRGQAPLYLGHGLRDGRRSDRRAGETGTGRLQELTTFHGVSPRVVVGPPTRGEQLRRIPAFAGGRPADSRTRRGKEERPRSRASEPLRILLSDDHPRRMARIWKVSKVYSATCHHRYSSPRNAAMLS